MLTCCGLSNSISTLSEFLIVCRRETERGSKGREGASWRMAKCRRAGDLVTPAHSHTRLWGDAAPQRLNHRFSFPLSLSSVVGDGSGLWTPKAHIPPISSLCSTLWFLVWLAKPRVPGFNTWFIVHLNINGISVRNFQVLWRIPALFFLLIF